MPYTDRNWQDFWRLADREHHADDPRFATVPDRVANVDALYLLLDEAVATKTTAEWSELCDTHSIPMAPVNDLAHLEDDPHYAAVGMIEEHEHPTEGPYRVVRSPMTFRSGLPGLHRPTARLGAHTAEVFEELGYDRAAIEALTPPRDQPPAGAGAG
jgi:crotonobetainyl-CoA:carnitine CoA-transferase CaiB-like acyl-CoA transferase